MSGLFMRGLEVREEVERVGPETGGFVSGPEGARQQTLSEPSYVSGLCGHWGYSTDPVFMEVCLVEASDSK